jgi:hypothetical protein
MCSFQGAAALVPYRAAAFRPREGDLQLSIDTGSVQLIPEACNDSSMLNRAPLHAFEIIFYSTASVLAAVGLTWYFLH